MHKVGTGEAMVRIWTRTAWATEHLRRARFFSKEAWRRANTVDELVHEMIMRDAQPKKEMRGLDSIIQTGREFARTSAAHSDSNWDGILLVY